MRRLFYIFLQTSYSRMATRILASTICFLICFCSTQGYAQVKWVNVDTEYGTLPTGFHVFRTKDSLDGKPFTAVYAIADLGNKDLIFTSDTTWQRRLTPDGFYSKNSRPLLVVNTTFFSFASNKNLNLVIKDGKLVSFNTHSVALKGKDSLTYKHPLASAIGISKKRKADVAWTYADSSLPYSFASQQVVQPLKDSTAGLPLNKAKQLTSKDANNHRLKKWKMQTAVGGGPVLVQAREIKITNNEELKFAGKAINDKHPRTLMGYTADNKIIIMVIEGRHPGIADGATLMQCAKLMADLGCIEALNLDGGGSSCMLINGRETIVPSDKGLQRAIPAVFIIKQKGKK